MDVGTLFTETETRGHTENESKSLDDQCTHTQVTVEDEAAENDLDFGHAAACSRVVDHWRAALHLLEPRLWTDAAFAVIVIVVVGERADICAEVLVKRGERNGGRDDCLGGEGEQARSHGEEHDRKYKETILCLDIVKPVCADGLGPVHPFVADGGTVAAGLVALGPANGAVPLLQVEQRGLGCVDDIGTDGGQNANDGDQHPALGTVEPSRQAAPDVLSAAKRLDTVCIGDVVVDPISRRELVVPHTVVLEERGLCRVHALLEAVAALAQGIDEALAEGVAARHGAAPAGAHAGARGQLAVVTRHAWAGGAGRRVGEALVGAGAAQIGHAQQGSALIDALSGPGEVGVGGAHVPHGAEGEGRRRGRGAAVCVMPLAPLGGAIVMASVVVVDAAGRVRRPGHGGGGGRGEAEEGRRRRRGGGKEQVDEKTIAADDKEGALWGQAVF